MNWAIIHRVLTLPQQFDLLRICVAHKHLYTERRGNNTYWRHVAFEFDNSAWDVNRVKKYVQMKIRQYRATPAKVLNGQMRQLLRELISQMELVDATLPRSRQRPFYRLVSRHTSSVDTYPQDPFGSQHTIPGSSSVHAYPQDPFTHSRPASTEHSDQELIAMSEEAIERGDYEEAKSRFLQISDKTVRDQRLKELDETRRVQILLNRELERQAKVAELEEDWETAKSLLSQIKGKEGPFLLLALEYSRRRPYWGLCDSEEVMEQLKKEYPDPRLEQVELDENHENAMMTGNPQRIGHHRGRLRLNRQRIGTLWEAPDDYRKVFQMMAEDMRKASDKAWYAPPAPSGEAESRTQSQSEPQPLDAADLLQRARDAAAAEPDIDEELRLLDKAREEIVKGHDKAKAILRQGSSEDSQEALKAVERGAAAMLADLEETECSLVAQAEDVSEAWTPEAQMTLLLLMEEESRLKHEKAKSLLAPYANSTQGRSLRKKVDQMIAKEKRYFQRCNDTLLAGGRLEDVEEEP